MPLLLVAMPLLLEPNEERPLQYLIQVPADDGLPLSLEP